jgi:hypothetical protein
MARTGKTLPNSIDYFLKLSFKNILKFKAYVYSDTVIHLESFNVYNVQLRLYRRKVYEEQ